MTNIFWRLAFKLYGRRKPSTRIELFAIGIVGLMTAIYAFAVYVNPTTSNIVRLLVSLLIVTIGFAHRRVRLECVKGPQALYGKAMTRDG